MEIGGLVCRLKLHSQKWEKLIREKYRSYETGSKLSKPTCTISFAVWRNNNFHLSFSPSLEEAKLYTPPGTKKFKMFDFFLKTAVATLFLLKGGFFLHSSSLLKNGKGLIFAGKKGAGKSTILKLSPNFTPLNDDFSIIKNEGGKYFVYSSPFYEKNPIPRTKIKAPIEKVFFLVKDKENRLASLETEEIITTIASLILMPNPKAFLSSRQGALILEKIWSKARDFARKNPCFMLYFKKDKSFLKLL